MDLRDALVRYKEFTIELIKTVEKEEYDSIGQLLDLRQGIIDEMKKIHYSSDELKNAVYELEILILQERLDNLLSEKKGKIKGKLDKLLENKNANMNYRSSNYSNSSYFNQRI